MSVPNNQHASPTPARYLYYRISGSASLKCAFDPREYIAQLEGIHPSQVEAIYFGVESGGPILDDTRITFVEEGGPGTSVKSPCASSLRETGSDAPFGSPTSATTLPMSPILNPAPFLRGGRPPSRAFSLPPTSYPRDTHIHPLHSSRSTASYNSFKSAPAPYRRATSPQSSSPPDPRWTIGSGGFAEPTESPTEAGKVVSRCRPPGWLSGHVQALGYGVYMGKLGKKHRGVTLGGTVLRDGMRVWVDAREMKDLTLRKGDKFRTYRVIVKDTREMTYLWVGDISIDGMPKVATPT